MMTVYKHQYSTDQYSTDRYVYGKAVVHTYYTAENCDDMPRRIVNSVITLYGAAYHRSFLCSVICMYHGFSDLGTGWEPNFFLARDSY